MYRCFATYRDALLELADAVLCKQDRVHMLADLSLEPEHRRGHGAVNCGRIDIARLRVNFAAADLDGLVRIVKRKLKKIQYRPHLIDGCLTATGLKIEPW